MKTALTAARLYTPTHAIDSPLVVLEDDRIVAMGPRSSTAVPSRARRFDFPGMILAPGFIDIHIHGGAGHDVMERDDRAIAAIERLGGKI